MTYDDEIKAHLSRYKREHLKIAEAGTFLYRGTTYRHHHILPHEHALSNFLPEAQELGRAFFVANPGKRHQYFHHLNSSQAFALNLFLPYFSGGPETAAPLLRSLGSHDVLVDWELEAIPVLEEESILDAVWTSANGTQTVCEVKLSEAGVGGAAINESRLEKLRDIYAPTLRDHLPPYRLQAEAFFKTYQFSRNLWHMLRTEQGRLVFLAPRANIGLWDQLIELREEIVPATRRRVSVISIEDVMTTISADPTCPPGLAQYSAKLRHKYILERPERTS